MTPRIALLAALPAALLLAACGFQLRGSYNVPDFLTGVSLKLPGGSQALEVVAGVVRRARKALHESPTRNEDC